jgi:TonB family protein
MKLFCLSVTWIVFYAFGNVLFAQDTTYYRHYFEKVQDPSIATSYVLVSYEDADSLLASETTYFMSDKIKQVTPYSNIKKREQHGVVSMFYESGELYSTQRYVQGKEEGIHHVYYKNGRIKREDHYKKGKLDKGNCFTESGADTTYFDFFKMPQLVGGDQKMLEFMAKNTKYPPLARENGIQGIVVISALITKTGAVENLRVLKSLSSELDAECIRVVSLMPDFEPGEMDGEKVAIQYNLPFRFSLR